MATTWIVPVLFPLLSRWILPKALFPWVFPYCTIFFRHVPMAPINKSEWSLFLALSLALGPFLLYGAVFDVVRHLRRPWFGVLWVVLHAVGVVFAVHNW